MMSMGGIQTVWWSEDAARRVACMSKDPFVTGATTSAMVACGGSEGALEAGLGGAAVPEMMEEREAVGAGGGGLAAEL